MKRPAQTACRHRLRIAASADSPSSRLARLSAAVTPLGSIPSSCKRTSSAMRSARACRPFSAHQVSRLASATCRHSSKTLKRVICSPSELSSRARAASAASKSSGGPARQKTSSEQASAQMLAAESAQRSSTARSSVRESVGSSGSRAMAAPSDVSSPSAVNAPSTYSCFVACTRAFGSGASSQSSCSVCVTPISLSESTALARFVRWISGSCAAGMAASCSSE
mmetsp:Transcript_51943/g.119488  ORF Transcript_51943/g.119488 Transcript_51943/m.119488 type:complete len:224 (-) Transcript_51943:1131-1802(-)